MWKYYLALTACVSVTVLGVCSTYLMLGSILPAREVGDITQLVIGPVAIAFTGLSLAAMEDWRYGLKQRAAMKYSRGLMN